jgi:hypothetical protein
MKALHQIIDYLRRSGLLSQDQLVEFASQGILRWDQVYEDRAGGEAEDEADDWPWVTRPEDEEVAEPGVRVRPRPGRRRAHHRAPVLSTEELCIRLHELSESWRQPLAGLVQVGQRLARSSTWEDAAVAVRNSPRDVLADALAAGLEAQAPTLPALWGVLDLEDHRGLVRRLGRHGPVANSYHVLLAVHDHVGLGPHAWLLREPEVAAIVNLEHARRHLLAACGEVLHTRPDVVAAALRRDGHTPGYWPLALVYTARRGKANSRPWPRAGERPPPRQPPADDDWPRRWGQALLMDRQAIPPFLVERTAQLTDRARLLAEAFKTVISALPDVPCDIAFRYYHRECSIAQVAVLLGISPDDVVRELAAFRQAIRHALSRQPALRVFLQPEPVRSLESFLADCLHWTWGVENHLFYPDLDYKLAELIRAHYGVAFDLLCPRSWD